MPFLRLISILLLLAFTSLNVMGERSVDAAQDIDRDRAMAVRAALILNFAKFVEWPGDAFDSPDDPLVIGVWNEPEFAEVLERTVRNQSVDNRRVIVRRLESSSDEPLPSLHSLRHCHVLSMAKSPRERQAELLKRIRESSILTVAEVDGFARRGGMIELDLVDARYTFRINPKAAERAGLKLSSRLLALATIIEEEKRAP